MSGYCPDCGNNPCVCDELFDELNMEGAVCMTKDVMDMNKDYLVKLTESIEARDDIIAELFGMITCGDQKWDGLFALKKKWEELKNER